MYCTICYAFGDQVGLLLGWQCYYPFLYQVQFDFRPGFSTPRLFGGLKVLELPARYPEAVTLLP